MVGATGLVGSTLLKVLEEYQFPIKELFLFASSKSIGKTILFKNKKHFIMELCIESFRNIDIVFFCAGSDTSREWARKVSELGSIVIDNSSCFRMCEDVSLIVPEINFNYSNNLISNPNCSTIQSVLCLNALKKFGLKRVVYNTYQAVSGSGIKGINDLTNKTSEFYPYDISKTCIPQIDSFLDNGYTKEEMKMIMETRKILSLPKLDVVATCVRVPVLNSHAVSVLVELETECSLDMVKEALRNQEGLVLVDEYPTSIHSNGSDLVYVGRVRKDLFKPNSFLFYCVADNIRRGAASNAVKIALKIIEKL